MKYLYIKILTLILFKLTFQLDTIIENQSIYQAKCLIHNQKFMFEYLVSFGAKNKLSTYPLKGFDNFNQIKWLLIRSFNNTFYIKSLTNNYFICSSEYEFANGILFSKNSRQIVKMVELSSVINDDRFCKWIFKKHEQDEQNIYMIWNDYFNKPLFASYFTMSSNIISARHVFLWYKQPDSKQFNWFVDCNKGQFLVS